MLAEPKLKALNAFAEGLSKDELIWVNGYLSARIETVAVANPAVVVSQKKLTIAYGTETGNAKKLAVEFAAKAKKKGLQPRLIGMDQYRLSDMEKEELFVSVISTQGEGEPPIAAQKFYDHLYTNGFTIPNMRYAVLALGDTAYPMFCKTGEDVDAQLQHLGAKRIFPLQKCDLDYEAPAHEWFDGLLHAIHIEQANGTKVPEKTAVATRPAGKQIFNGEIVSKINLNATGSANKTYHIELHAESVHFLPGDSIGVVPQNDEYVVDEIIRISELDPNEIVSFKNESAKLRELLINKININFLLEKFVKNYADLYAGEIMETRLNLLRLLQKYPLKDYTAFKDFVLGLHAIAPRIYNICSSPTALENEVHIIALADEFEAENSTQTGLCSSWFEDKNVGDTIPFFIQTNKRFRLPADDQNIIMIGPGTGVAPFRCFVWERDATGASGKNWLFFSNKNFTTDFYYQTEWQDWFGTGVLTNINVAFANQHQHITQKIAEQGDQLFSWLQNGASLYLCGEKEPLSKEIETSLLQVFQKCGGKTTDEAIAFFDELKASGRYMKDVY